MIYFRFPFSEKICTIVENSPENVVTFVPFEEGENLEFTGNTEEIDKEELLNQHSKACEFPTDFSLSELKGFSAEDQEEYEEKILKVIEFIKKNDLSKLVISRRKLVEFKGPKLNYKKTFLNLCESYPNAFVYFFLKDDQCWIGAFSEILGKFNKKTSRFETMSLAGTLPISEEWTPKEIEEQKPVTQFIKNILEHYSDKIEQSETYDHLSGNIKHLRTDFKLQIKKEELKNLIAELHPTPAVCGIPTVFCKKAIQHFESMPRNFYSGYIRVETEDFIQYFVNLRCAQFFENNAIIYVGGGITAESSPEKEWQETELKAEAILKNMAFL